MRIPRIPKISVVLAALSIPLLAGGAFAVASSVSTQPRPQTIIPARTSSVTSENHRSGPGKDDKPGHDATDDHGKDNKVGTTRSTTSDDPAGHDATDDHGKDNKVGTTTATTPDDHGHDGTTGTTTATTPDDHGHDGTTSTTVTTGTTTPDDHGGNSGHGGGSSHDG